MSDRYTIEIVLDGKDNVSQNLNKVNQELGELKNQASSGNQAASGLSAGFDTMATAVTGFISAYGLMEIGGKVLEMSQLGAEVRATQNVFTELAGGPEAAAIGMQQLRAATSGVVDDMTLAAGANSLLLTGLAATTEEAAGLTEVAVKLGGALGQGPADAIQNLNSALLNNSFERLDALGISAANVRERVNELKQSGMDMSEAFSTAVLEEGRDAIERLGDAANASVTATNILSTQWQNATQQAANLTNQVMETGAQLLILAEIAAGGTGGIPALEQQQAAAEAQAQQIADLTEQANYFRNATMASLPYFTDSYGLPEQVEIRVVPLIDDDEFVKQYLELSEEMQAQVSTGGFFKTAFSEQGTEAMRAAAREALTGLGEYGEQLQLLSDNQLAEYAADLDIRFQSIALAERQLTAETEQANAALAEQERIIADTAAWDAYTNAEMNAVDNMRLLRSESGLLAETFSNGVFGTSSGTMTFFDPDQLAAVQSQAEAVMDEYERLKNLGESSDYTLVSETEVERAREIARQAETIANDAERFATAWENASLTQIAGTSDGGRLNEFYQGVLGNIEDEDLRNQAEGQFNLASGVETANSKIIDYGEELVAAITEEFGVGAGQRAGQDFVTAFEEGVAQGLSGEELQDYVEEQVGFAIGTSADGGTGTGGTDVQVQAGEGYLALAERTGYTVDELMAATGGRMLMAGEVITVGDNQLIALGDTPSATETVNNAANNVLGMFGGNDGTETTATSSDYTYYDPATGTYSYSNNPEPTTPIEPEQADTISSAADDMLSIETSMTAISELDMQGTFTPMTDEIAASNEQLSQFDQDLQRVTGRDYRTRIGLVPFLDFAEIPALANNPAILQLFAAVLNANPQLITNATD